ncbi:MAG TPA: OsmC family protein [Xanthobacteraceae bacterium]|nr:OsmC family protein [Xanthobacteraceae bacterium]
MDIAKFRDLQEPIRARYRRDAAAAVLTLTATGTADDATVTCKVDTGRGPAIAGIHPKCGGSGLELCSGDLLLEALVACAGVSLKAAAAVLDIPVASARVFAEGDVDLRGTLGISDAVPVGFKEIRLRFELDTDAAPDRLAELLAVTERYCVIFQTIQKSPRTAVKIGRM